MTNIVVCEDGKLFQFPSEIIVPDFSVSMWNSALKIQSNKTLSVTSEENVNVHKLLLGLGVCVSGNTHSQIQNMENMTDCHLVDPETGF